MCHMSGWYCPNPGCGKGMMLDDSPGSNIRCATCQVGIVLILVVLYQMIRIITAHNILKGILVISCADI